jgi:hypothetical protein
MALQSKIKITLAEFRVVMVTYNNNIVDVNLVRGRICSGCACKQTIYTVAIAIRWTLNTGSRVHSVRIISDIAW